MESQPVRSWWQYSVRREMFWDSSMTVSLLKANLDRKQIFETDLVRDTETNSIPAETDVLTTIHFIVIAAVVILPEKTSAGTNQTLIVLIHDIMTMCT